MPLRFLVSLVEGRRKREEGRRKKEEGRRKREEGRRKKEEGGGKKEEPQGRRDATCRVSTKVKRRRKRENFKSHEKMYRIMF